jgi:hypothetical protein
MLRVKNTKQEDWVPRDKACSELGLKKTTFNKYVCIGKIPAHAISEGVVKFFHLPTLKGLTN